MPIDSTSLISILSIHLFHIHNVSTPLLYYSKSRNCSKLRQVEHYVEANKM